MTIEEEIKKEKEEALRLLHFLIEYEIAASWISQWVWWDWGQELIANYYIRKTRRKFRRYKLYKLLKNVKKEEENL